MNFINLRPANIEALTIFVISLQLLTQTAIGQVSDGDDQFQVYHQDIGRISGGATNSPVAPQTLVRQVAPSVPVAAAEVPAIEPIPQRSRYQSSQPSQQQQQQQQQARKPARFAHSARTRAPVSVTVSEPLASSVVPPVPVTYTEPSLQAQFNSQPNQYQPAAAVSAPHKHHAHSLARAPAQASTEPQFQAGPALASFSSVSGHANSVSARHSALMAQVAAERQAAAAGSGGDYASLEALASPAVAQVQPPPTVHHQPTAAASPALTFVNQPEEPIVAPSFDHVLSNGCPHKGVFSYPNKDHCDRYYMCTNGTFTEEACPNGLAYGQMGAVYQHCAYNWNVDCGNKKTSEPIASPGCPWQFGIFPVTSAGRCSLDYFVCEWGVPETKRCSPEGLFYDDRIKGCQWADQLGCKSEAVLNFKCPPEDEDNPYWPYPRYYHTKQDVVVCVNEQPRLVHCNEDQIVDPSSLACMDLNKKKKKF